jgi:hypothetical protein
MSFSQRFREDTIRSLVRWRLSDTGWQPRFEMLMDDLHTCMDISVTAQDVMLAIRDLAASDPNLAARASELSLDAQKHLRERLDAAGRTHVATEMPPSETAPSAAALPTVSLGKTLRGAIERLGSGR